MELFRRISGDVVEGEIACQKTQAAPRRFFREPCILDLERRIFGLLLSFKATGPTILLELRRLTPKFRRVAFKKGVEHPSLGFLCRPSPSALPLKVPLFRAHKERV